MLAKLREYSESLKDLEKQKTLLQNCQDDDEQWNIELKKAETIKSNLDGLVSGFDDKSLAVFEKKLKKQRKKRLSIKQRNEKAYLEREEKLRVRDELHQKIDKWQASISQQISDAKRKKELNEQADKILAEVRQKLIDVNRNIELMKTLVKLRKLRKDAAVRKGLFTPVDCDRKFETRSSVLLSMLERQKTDYSGEQRTLEAMLENEQLEDLKKKEARDKIIREKRMKAVHRKLFGPKEQTDMTDPVYMFRQYYLQGEYNPVALVQIRKEWDFFMVPKNTPGGSRIPMSWVLPTEPSSAGWASVLKK